MARWRNTSVIDELAAQLPGGVLEAEGVTSARGVGAGAVRGAAPRDWARVSCGGPRSLLLGRPGARGQTGTSSLGRQTW